VNPITALVSLVGALQGRPRRPRGVRVLVHDQWVDAHELVYVGKDDDGTDQWIARFNVSGECVTDLHIDVLPGRCSLALAFPTEPEESP
jgi:hypothetical protein